MVYDFLRFLIHAVDLDNKEELLYRAPEGSEMLVLDITYVLWYG